MSAASLASYLIGKLKSDEAATGDMSGRGRGSPTPRLTTVWRTKSIPYDIPDTNNSFRNEGSFLRLLRTKSMPMLGREGSTPPRRLAVPPQASSPTRSESPSPVRHSTSCAMTSRRMSSGHLSDASESTVPSVATPPPTPRSPSPSGPRLRSASDGHLWQRRKKQMRRATDKAAVTLPSVKNLRGKFDEKLSSPPHDKQPPAGPVHVDGEPLKEDSKTDEEREGRRMSRHYSLLRREVKSPERRQPAKPAITPANIRKLLEKFETSPQDEDVAGEVFSESDPQDLRSKCRSEVSLKTTVSEVPQNDQTRRRTCHVTRQRTKNHRRSKSEPDPSAVLRHHAQASPPSVKKLKIMFERGALAAGGSDLTREATPERTVPVEKQEEMTPEPPQTRVPQGKAAEETVAVDSSAADTLHMGVVDAPGPRQQAKIRPIVAVNRVLAAGTPSVRSLRQRFEEGASAQSSVKTADEEVASKPRRAIVHQLKTPFEKSERQKSRSVSPEKENRHSLTSFSSASVKNLMRQFEGLTPEETKREAQGDLGHDPRSPRNPPPTDLQKRLQTPPLDYTTGEAESANKFTLEMEVDSTRRVRRQSRTSSSESSSGDEWREEEGIRRRKVMEQERKKKEEQEEMERQRIEQEEKMLREKIEMERIAKEMEKERIMKEKEKEKWEKESVEQERQAKENEEKERRAKEILEKEREEKEKLEEERKIREKAEQERLAKKEEEKRKERELLQQEQKEKEKAELEIKKTEREEREKTERQREEEERKERERAKHEEMQEKAEEERREREEAEKEKAQEKEKLKKREREETERLQNEQLEEERRKEEVRRSKEELRRKLSDEEMPKGLVTEEAHENKPDDKPSDRKVPEMIDRFKHLGHRGDDLPPDASSPPQGKASSEQRVERLIDQFTNLRDVDLEGEARKGDAHFKLDGDGHEDENTEGRRQSDVAALVNKFRKLNERRKSSSSSESESESESESGKSHKKPVKKEAPIPTIPARSSGPGKVRTLREDEMRFFESSAGGGGGAGEPFMRTQSLRVKKTEQSHFTQPRFGSLRGSKTRVAVLSNSSTTTAALPKNCRRLNTDELRFFTGEVTNIYRSRTTKPRGRGGKTGGGDGRPPRVPRDNALPNTEEFFRIAGRGDPGGEPNGRPVSEDDSDSEPSVLRSGEDVITDSEGDIYEMDINLKSDADTEDLSDTEHHFDLDHPLSLLVHSIQGELLQPVTSEDCKEAESRCYVVFSPESYFRSSEDEDEALQFPSASHTLKENVPTPALKENGISPAVQVQEGSLHDAHGEVVMPYEPTGNSAAEQCAPEHTKGEDHTSQPVVSTYSSEEDSNSLQLMDFSQHGGLTTTENGAIIDFLGETKVDFRPLEGIKGFVLTDRETGETSGTDNKEGGPPLLIPEKRDSNDEKEKVKKDEEDNIKMVNLLEEWSEEHDLQDSQLQEEQRAIAAFLDELDRLNSRPPTTKPPPPPTWRRENPYQPMNDDDSSSDTSSEDSQEQTGMSAEDVRSIEEQIIPQASFQGLLACPEGPSSTPHGDDGSPGTAKDLRNTETPSQDPITPLGTTEDLFIAAPPWRTQESVLTNSFNDALKEGEEEGKEIVEKEDNHTSSQPSLHPERQEEEKTEIGETTVLKEDETEQTTPSEEEEDVDIITGREFIKFCIFSLWFSLVMYFFSDFLK